MHAPCFLNFFLLRWLRYFDYFDQRLWLFAEYFESFRNKNLSVTFDSKVRDALGRILTKSSIEVSLPTVQILTDEERARIEAAESAGALAESSAFSTATTSSASGLLSILGSTSASSPVAWAFVQILQSMSYLLLLNVNHPEILQSFLLFFMMARLTFIPNPFSDLEIFSINTSSDEVLLSENAQIYYYNLYGFESYVLMNSGTFIAILLGFLFGFSVFRCFKKRLKKIKNQYFRLVLHKVTLMFEFNLFFRLVNSSFLEIFTFSVLNVYYVGDVSNWYYCINLVVAWIFVLLAFGYIFLMAIVLKRLDIEKPSLKFEAIYGEFELDRWGSKYFPILDQLRQMFFSILAICTYRVKMLQMILIVLLNFSFLVALIYYRPYKEKLSVFRDTFNHAGFFVANVVMVVLALDDIYEFFSFDQRDYCAYAILVSFGLVLILQLVLMIKEEFEMIMEFVRVCKRLRLRIKRREKRKAERIAAGKSPDSSSGEGDDDFENLGKKDYKESSSEESEPEVALELDEDALRRLSENPFWPRMDNILGWVHALFPNNVVREMEPEVNFGLFRKNLRRLETNHMEIMRRINSPLKESSEEEKEEEQEEEPKEEEWDPMGKKEDGENQDDEENQESLFSWKKATIVVEPRKRRLIKEENADSVMEEKPTEEVVEEEKPEEAEEPASEEEQAQEPVEEEKKEEEEPVEEEKEVEGVLFRKKKVNLKQRVQRKRGIGVHLLEKKGENQGRLGQDLGSAEERNQLDEAILEKIKTRQELFKENEKNMKKALGRKGQKAFKEKMSLQFTQLLPEFKVEEVSKVLKELEEVQKEKNEENKKKPKIRKFIVQRSEEEIKKEFEASLAQMLPLFQKIKTNVLEEVKQGVFPEGLDQSKVEEYVEGEVINKLGGTISKKVIDELIKLEQRQKWAAEKNSQNYKRFSSKKKTIAIANKPRIKGAKFLLDRNDPGLKIDEDHQSDPMHSDERNQRTKEQKVKGRVLEQFKITTDAKKDDAVGQIGERKMNARVINEISEYSRFKEEKENPKKIKKKRNLGQQKGTTGLDISEEEKESEEDEKSKEMERVLNGNSSPSKLSKKNNSGNPKKPKKFKVPDEKISNNPSNVSASIKASNAQRENMSYQRFESALESQKNPEKAGSNKSDLFASNGGKHKGLTSTIKFSMVMDEEDIGMMEGERAKEKNGGKGGLFKSIEKVESFQKLNSNNTGSYLRGSEMEDVEQIQWKVGMKSGKLKKKVKKFLVPEKGKEEKTDKKKNDQKKSDKNRETESFGRFLENVELKKENSMKPKAIGVGFEEEKIDEEEVEEKKKALVETGKKGKKAHAEENQVQGASAVANEKKKPQQFKVSASTPSQLPSGGQKPKMEREIVAASRFTQEEEKTESKKKKINFKLEMNESSDDDERAVLTKRGAKKEEPKKKDKEKTEKKGGFFSSLSKAFGMGGKKEKKDVRKRKEKNDKEENKGAPNSKVSEPKNSKEAVLKSSKEQTGKQKEEPSPESSSSNTDSDLDGKEQKEGESIKPKEEKSKPRKVPEKLVLEDKTKKEAKVSLKKERNVNQSYGRFASEEEHGNERKPVFVKKSQVPKIKSDAIDSSLDEKEMNEIMGFDPKIMIGGASPVENISQISIGNILKGPGSPVEKSLVFNSKTSGPEAQKVTALNKESQIVGQEKEKQSVVDEKSKGKRKEFVQFKPIVPKTEEKGPQSPKKALSGKEKSPDRINERPVENQALARMMENSKKDENPKQNSRKKQEVKSQMLFQEDEEDKNYMSDLYDDVLEMSIGAKEPVDKGKESTTFKNQKNLEIKGKGESKVVFQSSSQIGERESLKNASLTKIEETKSPLSSPTMKEVPQNEKKPQKREPPKTKPEIKISSDNQITHQKKEGPLNQSHQSQNKKDSKPLLNVELPARLQISEERESHSKIEKNQRTISKEKGIFLDPLTPSQASSPSQATPRSARPQKEVEKPKKRVPERLVIQKEVKEPEEPEKNEKNKPREVILNKRFMSIGSDNEKDEGKPKDFKQSKELKESKELKNSKHRDGPKEIRKGKEGDGFKAQKTKSLKENTARSLENIEELLQEKNKDAQGSEEKRKSKGKKRKKKSENKKETDSVIESESKKEGDPRKREKNVKEISSARKERGESFASARKEGDSFASARIEGESFPSQMKEVNPPSIQEKEGDPLSPQRKEKRASKDKKIKQKLAVTVISSESEESSYFSYSSDSSEEEEDERNFPIARQARKRGQPKRLVQPEAEEPKEEQIPSKQVLNIKKKKKRRRKKKYKEQPYQNRFEKQSQEIHEEEKKKLISAKNNINMSVSSVDYIDSDSSETKNKRPSKMSFESKRNSSDERKSGKPKRTTKKKPTNLMSAFVDKSPSEKADFLLTPNQKQRQNLGMASRFERIQKEEGSKKSRNIKEAVLLEENDRDESEESLNESMLSEVSEMSLGLPKKQGESGSKQKRTGNELKKYQLNVEEFSETKKPMGKEGAKENPAFQKREFYFDRVNPEVLRKKITGHMNEVLLEEKEEQDSDEEPNPRLKSQETQKEKRKPQNNKEFQAKLTQKEVSTQPFVSEEKKEERNVGEFRRFAGEKEKVRTVDQHQGVQIFSGDDSLITERIGLEEEPKEKEEKKTKQAKNKFEIKKA